MQLRWIPPSRALPAGNAGACLALASRRRRRAAPRPSRLGGGASLQLSAGAAPIPTQRGLGRGGGRRWLPLAAGAWLSPRHTLPLTHKQIQRIDVSGALLRLWDRGILRWAHWSRSGSRRVLRADGRRIGHHAVLHASQSQASSSRRTRKQKQRLSPTWDWGLRIQSRRTTQWTILDYAMD